MTMYDPERITYFAKTDARGVRVPFGIKAKDRTKHMYVIGKSGMGKSTLLENLAVQDIKNGEGIAFIDPHGGSAEALLDFIPEERMNDVLYFNPSDMQFPIAFNIMENVEPDKRFLVVSGLMSVFKKIWIDAWSARMEYILQNTLMALLEYPGATLLGVNRMLSDKGYRDAVVANVKDASVRSFWVDEFAKYNERYMQEAGDAIKNKIGQFTANPIIRNIVGQQHTSFDIRKMMDERKILIVNLSKGLIGETNTNLLGSMLTTRIYLSAMSRADLSAQQMAKMPNFYFYVDEFQSFANATFANILSEARKYKLNLTIAHQYIDQMEEDVRNAVFGNVGTTISFRVGPMDGEVLEKIFMPAFTALDLVNLGFSQIYLSLMIDGVGSSPFSATTLPPIVAPEISYRDVVVGRSRANFGKRRDVVEAEIAQFYADTFESADAAPKKKIVRAPGAQERSEREPRESREPREPRELSARTHAGGESRRPERPRGRVIPEGVPQKETVSQAGMSDLRAILRGMTEQTEDRAAISAKERRERMPKNPTAPKRPNREHMPKTTGSMGATEVRPEGRRDRVVDIVEARKPERSLKDALAEALAAHEQTKPAVSVVVDEAPVAHAPVRDSFKVPTAPALQSTQELDASTLRGKLRERAHAHSDPSEFPLQEPEKQLPKITPQALAHMMRVSSSDKPPKGI